MSYKHNIPDPDTFQPKPEDLTTEWKSSPTGHTYTSREAMAKAEMEHAMRFGRTKEDEFNDSLSAEQLRALDKKVRMAAEKKVQDKEEFGNAVVFSKLHPEYLVCPQNASQMLFFFQSKGIEKVNLEMLEEAFEILKAQGLLLLDQNVLRQKRPTSSNSGRRKFASSARQCPPRQNFMSPRSIVGRDTAGSANSTTRNFNDTKQPVHDTARRVTPTDELIKDLTPEQAEVLLKRASLSNCEWSERSLAAVAIDEFLKRHKAYLNNDHNKAEIVFYLQQHNLPTTLASLESAYYSLVRAGLLSIDQPEFNKEEGARR